MQFGIITTVAGMESIVIQSINNRTSVDIAEARDETGKVIALKAYSQAKHVDIRALVNTNNVKTAAGQTLSIDNQTYIIETTDQAETNVGWVEVSLAARTADSATITGIDATTPSA